MRARSKKRARLYRDERAPLVAELLAVPYLCDKCMAAYAVDVHEIKSRARGGSITDRKNLLRLCRKCHDWVTQHPAEALRDGFLASSWD